MSGFTAWLAVNGVQEDCASQSSSHPGMGVSSTEAPFGLGSGPMGHQERGNTIHSYKNRLFPFVFPSKH